MIKGLNMMSRPKDRVKDSLKSFNAQHFFYCEVLGFSGKAHHDLTPHRKLGFLYGYFGLAKPEIAHKSKARQFLNSIFKDTAFRQNPTLFELKKVLLRKHVSGEVDSVDYNEDIIFFARSRNFYRSQRWKALRIEVLSGANGRCEACGASVDDGAVLHVDHIYPRSIYPELCLTKANLQVLCDECNIGKSNTLIHDFRKGD